MFSSLVGSEDDDVFQFKYQPSKNGVVVENIHVTGLPKWGALIKYSPNPYVKLEEVRADHSRNLFGVSRARYGKTDAEFPESFFFHIPDQASSRGASLVLTVLHKRVLRKKSNKDTFLGSVTIPFESVLPEAEKGGGGASQRFDLDGDDEIRVMRKRPRRGATSKAMRIRDSRLVGATKGNGGGTVSFRIRFTNFRTLRTGGGLLSERLFPVKAPRAAADGEASVSKRAREEDVILRQGRGGDAGREEDLQKQLEELETKYEDMVDQRSCVICLDAEKRIAFVPCGHISCCPACSQTVKECPMCRVAIQSRLKVFM